MDCGVRAVELLISLSRKFIFIANYKTASTAIEEALGPFAEISIPRTEWGKHQSFADLENRFGWIFEAIPRSEFAIFGVIRDPVERIISLYRSHKHEKFVDRPDVYTGNMDFETFLGEWCERNQASLRPQAELLVDGSGENAVNFVLNFQHISAQFSAFTQSIGLALPPLLKRNQSPADAHRPIVSPDDLIRIRSLFASDYQLLDSFEKFRDAQPDEAGEAAERAYNLSRSEVINGYELLLGRYPESDEVISLHRRLRDRRTLRMNMMNSKEFRNKFPAAITSVPQRAPNLDRPVRIFLHIPKCAGTTLHRALVDAAGGTACPERHNGLWNWPAGMLAEWDLFSGHFDRPSLDLIPGGNKQIVTVLRRPEDRLVSLYRFLRSHTPDAVRGQGGDMGLVDLARRHDAAAFFALPELAGHPSIDNGMIRQLTGVLGQKRWEAIVRRPAASALFDEDQAAALEQAFAALSEFAAFGLVEDMARSMAVLFDALGLTVPESLENRQVTDRLPRSNRLLEPVPPVDMSPELKAALEPHIRWDALLYERAARLYHRRLRRSALKRRIGLGGGGQALRLPSLVEETPPPPTLSPVEVVEAFQAVLRRNPESDQVIEAHSGFARVEDLHAVLRQSREYRERFAGEPAAEADRPVDASGG